jgi:hypothetical protein
MELRPFSGVDATAAGTTRCVYPALGVPTSTQAYTPQFLLISKRLVRSTKVVDHTCTVSGCAGAPQTLS